MTLIPDEKYGSTPAARKHLAQLISLDNTVIDSESRISTRQLLALLWIAIHDDTVRRAHLTERRGYPLTDAELSDACYQLKKQWIRQLGSANDPAIERDGFGAPLLLIESDAFCQLVEALDDQHPDIEATFIDSSRVTLKGAELARANAYINALQAADDPLVFLAEIRKETEESHPIWDRILADVQVELEAYRPLFSDPSHFTHFIATGFSSLAEDKAPYRPTVVAWAMLFKIFPNLLTKEHGAANFNAIAMHEDIENLFASLEAAQSLGLLSGDHAQIHFEAIVKQKKQEILYQAVDVLVPFPFFEKYEPNVFLGEMGPAIFLNLARSKDPMELAWVFNTLRSNGFLTDAHRAALAGPRPFGERICQINNTIKCLFQENLLTGEDADSIFNTMIKPEPHSVFQCGLYLVLKIAGLLNAKTMQLLTQYADILLTWNIRWQHLSYCNRAITAEELVRIFEIAEHHKDNPLAGQAAVQAYINQELLHQKPEAIIPPPGYGRYWVIPDAIPVTDALEQHGIFSSSGEATLMPEPQANTLRIG